MHLGDLVVEGPGPGADDPGGVDGAAGRFVVPGRGAGFSVEAPEGVRFIIRSRLLSDDEWAALDVA